MTFCIIAIERPRHGRVIVDTPVPVLGNDTISLLGAGEEGLNLKWSKHNHYGIEIEVPDHVLDKVSYYVTKTIACNPAAPNMSEPDDVFYSTLAHVLAGRACVGVPGKVQHIRLVGRPNRAVQSMIIGRGRVTCTCNT